MTIEAAMAHAAALPHCAGFTYQSATKNPVPLRRRASNPRASALIQPPTLDRRARPSNHGLPTLTAHGPPALTLAQRLL